MEQIAVAGKRRYCIKCGYDEVTTTLTCPQCKRPLRTSTETRMSGFFQTFAGALLMGLMVFLLFWLVNVVREGEQTGHSRFTGTQNQLMVIYSVFGFVLVFGLLSFSSGLWQLATGKRNKVFGWLVAFMAMVLLAGVLYVIFTF
jgi:magnesium-transporting ATPase (P-type)